MKLKAKHWIKYQGEWHKAGDVFRINEGDVEEMKAYGEVIEEAEDKADEAGKNGETRLDELLRSLDEALTEAGETGKARLDELLSSLGEALKEAGQAGEARFNELLQFLGEVMNKAGETGEARLDELRIYLQEKKPELVNGFSSLLDSLIGLLEK